jgi:transposase
VTPTPDPSKLSHAEKDAIIAALVARLAASQEIITAQALQLTEQNERIAVQNARIAALEARIDELTRPPKTPQNSSTPPSQGHKANGTPADKKSRKGHPGAARALHPNPTRRCNVVATHCQHCQADVSVAPQAVMQCYDRIELPEIKPDVTRVVLHGGICPCCTKRFKADPPKDLEPGSPFGPNHRIKSGGRPARFRAVPALFPSHFLRTPGAPDVRPARAGDQRGRTEQHAGHQPSGVCRTGQPNPSAPAVRYRPAVG